MELNELKEQLYYEEKSRYNTIERLKRECDKADESLITAVANNMNTNLFYVNVDENINTLWIGKSPFYYNIDLEKKHLELIYGESKSRIISLNDEQLQVFKLIFNKKLQDMELQKQRSLLDTLQNATDYLH